MNTWVALSTFALSRTHYDHPFPELLELLKISSQTETQYPLNNESPFWPSLISWTILFSASMNLTTLGTLCKWEHIAFFFLLWLTYFTYHNVFRVHSCCSIWECSSSSRLNNIPFCVYTTCCPSVNLYLGYFYFLAIVNNAAVNIGIQKYVWVLLSIFGYIPRSRITW